ncbi:MAG: 4a-hydroxytetrahydrobiopterin dehydratase [Ignavibacteria bacterium]|nr:4a-hydroxytetrahydrobiopterin dehydratase [Ignavibacteria bacterium]
MLLSQTQIQIELQKLSVWKLAENEITKQFVFKDFIQAIGFINQVAILAEKFDHHPDIDIRWNKVTLTLFTHSAGGLTEKDFILAKEIDKIVS